jgi:pimeloyl-ACP methyl ester carboxylesterase
MANKKNNVFINDNGKGGIPVVILHSLAGNSEQWTKQLESLRKSRRVIALDLPGHGKSASTPKDGFTVNELSAIIQESIDSLNIKKYYLAGHSMGAAIAAVLAADRPERTEGLLLLDPAGDSTRMPNEQVQQYLGAIQSEGYTEFMDGYWNHLLAGSKELTRQQVMEDLHNTDRKTVINYFKALFVFNPVPYLYKYPGPKMIVYTDSNDMPVSLHNIVKSILSKKIKGTGHWLQMDKPETVNKIFDDFIGN